MKSHVYVYMYMYLAAELLNGINVGFESRVQVVDSRNLLLYIGVLIAPMNEFTRTKDYKNYSVNNSQTH